MRVSSCLLALSSLGGREGERERGRDGVGRTRAAGVDGAIPGKDGQRSERSRRGGRERYSDPENEELVAGANLDQFSSCAAVGRYVGRRDEREYAKRKTHERGKEGKIDLCCLHRPPRSLQLPSDESRISLAGGRERRTFTE